MLGSFSAGRGGLKAFPGNDLLSGNAAAAVYHWAEPVMKAKRWDTALATWMEELDRFPGRGRLAELKAFCEERKAKSP